MSTVIDEFNDLPLGQVYVKGDVIERPRFGYKLKVINELKWTVKQENGKKFLEGEGTDRDHQPGDTLITLDGTASRIKVVKEGTFEQFVVKNANGQVVGTTAEVSHPGIKSVTLIRSIDHNSAHTKLKSFEYDPE